MGGRMNAQCLSVCNRATKYPQERTPCASWLFSFSAPSVFALTRLQLVWLPGRGSRCHYTQVHISTTITSIVLPRAGASTKQGNSCDLCAAHCSVSGPGSTTASCSLILLRTHGIEQKETVCSPPPRPPPPTKKQQGVFYRTTQNVPLLSVKRPRFKREKPTEMYLKNNPLHHVIE